MAMPLPDALKSADISRFVTRAAQIERAKPAIAYWAYYWIVQQIVTKGLHKANEECMNYTAQLMDKLEEAKLVDDDAIKDEIAAKALIEQFGLEVFSRADNAVRASKASRQTADTFQAAYTFLELLQIWPPLEPEITAKIKFAKYHALRIAKAIKAGEDPNASNPISEPEIGASDITILDPNDPEVQALTGSRPPPHASVEEVADEQNHTGHTNITTPTLSQPVYPPRNESMNRPDEPPSPYQNAENYYHTSKDVSPIGPPSASGPPSIGGGYFPTTSNEMQPSPPSGPIDLPTVPSDVSNETLGMSPINHPLAPTSPSTFSVEQPPAPAAYPPPRNHSSTFQYDSIPTRQPTAPTYISEPAPVVDDQAMTAATKHARWAISALNFEDVPTAVKELRQALEKLGAKGPW